jgi:ribonuclease HII
MSLAQGLRGTIYGPDLEMVKGGDHPLINAASVVAKVYFDALMAGFGQFWKGYGMEQYHGSLSEGHKKALKRHGPSPVHRQWNYAADWWRIVLEG